MHKLIILLPLLICVGTATAERLVTTPEGDEIPVSIYPAEGDSLVV